MKKQLNVILLLGLCCQLINTQTPTGSYTNSCDEILMIDGNLRARCKYRIGDWPYEERLKWTVLPIVRLDQEVFNCNGDLSTKPC